MQKGFIALFTVIIISALLLAVVAAANTAAFFLRAAFVGSEQQRAAQALAEGCEQEALLQLAQNYAYDPAADPRYLAGKGAPETIGSGTCYIADILELSQGANSRVVKIDIWAQVGSAFASRVVSAQVQPQSAPQVLGELEE